MATGLIDIMKRAAVDAVENGKPCDLRYGTVISISPLKVQITPQFILPKSALIVPQHLTEYTVKVNVDWTTDEVEAHTHKVEGNKTLKINNSLKVGDKVALLRQSGGQSYLILDRI